MTREEAAILEARAAGDLAADVLAGIKWWNALTREERAARIMALGPSATVAAAWEAHKREQG